MNAVMAIYARENGQGMMFADEGEGGDTPPDDGGSDDKKPKLTVVK